MSTIRRDDCRNIPSMLLRGFGMRIARRVVSFLGLRPMREDELLRARAVRAPATSASAPLKASRANARCPAV